MTSPSGREPIPWQPSEAELVEALEAYRQGAFPMSSGVLEDRRPDYDWFFSDPRAILPLDGLRMSRSLRSRIRSGRFRITSDRAFEQVVFACQHVHRKSAEEDRAEESESWISDDYRTVITELHRLGHAHSVEAWLADDTEEPATDPRLVGGVYGMQVGGIFCGESMFSLKAAGGSDASKVCIAHLVAHLRARDFSLLDAQILNPFTESLGVREVPLLDFQDLLSEERDRELDWNPEDLDQRPGTEVLTILDNP